MRRLPLAMLVVFGAGLIFWAASSLAAEPAPEVRVTVDAFSGRADAPTWLLSDREARSFVALVRQLPPTAPVELPNRLGYRGFVVEVAQPRARAPERLTVQAGVVERETNGATEFYADVDQAIERWLLDLAAPHAPDVILSDARQQLR